MPTYWYDIGGWWRYDFGGRHALDKKAAREGIKILWKSIYNFYKSDAFFYPPRLRRNLYYNSFTYWTGRGLVLPFTMINYLETMYEYINIREGEGRTRKGWVGM